MSKRSIELTAGESLIVGDARITLLEKSGRRARIAVDAPSATKIVHPIPGAHECASTPEQGKELTHGQHAL